MRKWMFGLMAVMAAGLAFAGSPKTVVLDVQNMTCPTCRLTIEKAMDTVPGVATTHVDARASTVTVTFDAQRTTAPAIARAITEAGFPAKARTHGG